jgi:Cu/Ag efflux pump CusA
LLKGMYRSLLVPIIHRPFVSIGLVGIAFSVTVLVAMRLGVEFLPSFQETDFLMHWVERPGASLESMQRVTILASKELRAIKGVRNFGAHIGRAEVADEVVGPNFTELWISVNPDEPGFDMEKTHAEIQKVVDGYPGLKRDLLTYLKERIKEVITGTGASIVVRVYGPDLAVLRAKGDEIKAVMATVDGVHDLNGEAQVLVSQLQVRPKAGAIARFGLTPGQVRQGVATMVKGTKVGEIYQDQMSFDVVVRGTPEVRTDVESLSRLLIDLPQGGHVPLGDVADLRIVPAPNEIKRESASRRLDISCNVKGRDLGSVATEIEAKVKELSFDRGYHPEFLGEYAALKASWWRLITLGGLAILGIILLLHMDFQSWRLTAIVAFTIPFALIGGVLAAALQGGALSLGSFVGFVTVLGIAARNGIMLVSHFRHLELEEGEAFSTAMVLRGAEERLIPILMTALATGLALVPLVIAGNKPGHEIEYPLAVVIVGGLVTSTLLNLFLLPPIYARFGRVRINASSASEG